MSLLAQLSTAQAIIPAEREEIMWETGTRTAIVIAASALLSAIPVSIERSNNLGIRVTADTAQARIGRPLTPLSVAGVNRRAARRGAYYGGYYRPGLATGALATGAIAAGAGSYYGYGYGSPATYRYGYPGTYGYSYPATYRSAYPGTYGYSYPATYGYGYPRTYGYGYGSAAGNSCMRQQRVWTGYNYQWQWVRTC